MWVGLGFFFFICCSGFAECFHCFVGVFFCCVCIVGMLFSLFQWSAEVAVTWLQVIFLNIMLLLLLMMTVNMNVTILN